MQNVTPSPAVLAAPRQFGIFDNFDWFVTAHRWTSLAADSGSSVATTTAAGGGVLLTTGATDNNEASISLTNKIFKFAADKSMTFDAMLQYAEANTDDANVMLGFSSTFAANAMIDDGAGPAASFSGVVFYKVDGGTVWRVRSSIGTTNTDTVLTNTAGGTAAQRFQIEARCLSLTRVELTFKIDGQPVLDPSAGYHKQLLHVLDATSAAAMSAGAYVKAGGATTETPTLLYVGAEGIR